MYNPDRIQKIGEIMPGLCEYAQAGDKIHLGLEGDPEFPAAYRGTSRPTGTIQSIRNEGDATIVTAKMDDGRTRELSSRTIGAYDTWEFTEEGFRGVLAREEKKSARAEQALEYRGTSDSDTKSLETKIAQLEDFVESQQAFRKVVVSTMSEIAKDVVNLSKVNGLEAKFCGTLTDRYSALMESRAESSFRGSPALEEDEKFRHINDNTLNFSDEASSDDDSDISS